MSLLQSSRLIVLPSRSHLGGSSSRATAKSSTPRQRRTSSSSAAAAGKQVATEAAATTKSTSLLGWYSNKLDTHPVLTKSITSAIIAAAGDAGCQKVSSQKGEPFDLKRCARFFILGGALVGPAVHWWYGTIVSLLPGQTPARVILRVCADQFLFSPVCLSAFLSSLWTLESTQIVGDETKHEPFQQKLKSELPGVLQANWGFWFPVLSLNFGFVPLKFQVLFSNVASLAWNGYLSSMAAQMKQKKKLAETDEARGKLLTAA